MRCLKDCNTVLVLGLVFWVGFSLAPGHGVALAELEVEAGVAQGDPGDGLGGRSAVGDPMDGLGGPMFRTWGDPTDGLDLPGDPRDGLDLLRVNGDPGDGMDGHGPQVHGDPADIQGLLGKGGMAVLLPEYWFFMRGNWIP